MGSFLFVQGWAALGNIPALKMIVGTMSNNIYMQIALIMLVGLLAKNAILIVEFALERRRMGITIRRGNHDLDGGIHIETADDIRAIYLLHRNELGNRSHIVTALYLDVLHGLHILTQIGIRLHHYTVHLTETVEVRGI